MIFRVLGGLSLLIGAFFAVVTVLVGLTFLSSFSMSLLVLTGVFGVLAYVFLAIGWQLVRPPAARTQSHPHVHPEGADDEVAQETAQVQGDAVATQPDAPPQTVAGLAVAAEVTRAEGVGVLGGQGPESVAAAQPPQSFGPPPPLEAEPESDATPATTFSGFDEQVAPPSDAESILVELEAGTNGGTPSGEPHASGVRAHFKKPGAPLPDRNRSQG